MVKVQWLGLSSQICPYKWGPNGNPELSSGPMSIPGGELALIESGQGLKSLRVQPPGVAPNTQEQCPTQARGI